MKVKEHDYQLGLFDTAGQVRRLGVGTQQSETVNDGEPDRLCIQDGGGNLSLVSKGRISNVMTHYTRWIHWAFSFFNQNILNYNEIQKCLK